MGHSLGYRKLNTQEDFYETEAYTKAQIADISDPEGGNTLKPPTSIPSPFAAMDLTRTAFQRIVSSPDLKGTLIDQKLVSQCWDVGEVFFNSAAFSDDLEIISWSKTRSLKTLLEDSPHPGHKILGETIQMFLKQDAQSYNFDDFNELFILKYKYNVLGRNVTFYPIF